MSARFILPRSLGKARCVVLTGVHGFISARVLEEGLRAFGDQVTMIGADLEGTHSRRAAQRARAAGDFEFMDRVALLEKLSTGEIKPALIIHNGACSSTTETDPEVFRVLNLDYSKAIWKICSEQKIPLLYASSASVYGDGLAGFDDSPECLSRYSALNLYARSKIDFDRFAAEADSEPPRWVGLRYFNVYGACEDHKGGQASMVYHGFHQVMKTGRIRLFKGDPGAQMADKERADWAARRYPDGEQMRDFVSVRDVVSITWQLAAQMMAEECPWSDRLGQIWNRKGFFLNVGTGKARSWNELANSLFSALGKKPSIEYFEMPASLKAQYQNFTEAFHRTAQRLELPFEWTPLEDGVRDYVQHDLMTMTDHDQEK